MPNFDAGSYFLTVLAPIRSGAVSDAVGAESWHERLAATLEKLPTALQSPATERSGEQSPFARSLRTHLARFVVIDDTVYNGRPPQNPVLTSLFGPDPIVADAPDRLNSAYLMFAAETDAVTEDGARLPATLSPAEQDAVRDSYARHLWGVMADELRAVFGCCRGFEKVADADGFAAWIARCQVETTMPFHDYWTRPPALPSLPFKAILVVALAPIAVLLLALLGWLAGMAATPVVSWFVDWRPGPTIGWALLASVLALWAVYRFVMGRGEAPFPPPGGANLPGVLKSLYLQQKFTDFASASQELDAAGLHKAFGAFLAEHRPGEDAGPTQPPGVVRLAQPQAPPTAPREARVAAAPTKPRRAAKKEG